LRQGVSILLGEYAKNIAKTSGVHDVGANADREQQWVNDKVSGAAKVGLDAMDSAAEAFDKKIAEITAVLVDYIERIRSGG
jgi:hypothetical protein